MSARLTLSYQKLSVFRCYMVRLTLNGQNGTRKTQGYGTVRYGVKFGRFTVFFGKTTLKNIVPFKIYFKNSLNPQKFVLLYDIFLL